MHTILKEQTAAKHKIAERKLFNVLMFQGKLDQQDYLTYLEQQLAVFEEMEKYPLPHPALNRVKALQEDILELLQQGCVKKGILPATQACTHYLSTLNQQEQLPHVYLHYLAILYGGQMMRRKVPSQGNFYKFDEFEACIASIRTIQQDSWADEVNKGFDFVIDLFDSLEKNCFTNKMEANA